MSLALRPKAIALTHRQAAVVDYRDWLWAREFKWFCTQRKPSPSMPLGKIGYAARSARKAEGGSGGDKLIWLHIAVLERHIGPRPSPDHIGDHENGDRLDCRLSNLRWATKRENARNIHGIYHRQPELPL